MPDLHWQKQGLILSPDDGPAWRQKQCGMVSVMPLKPGQSDHRNAAYRIYLTGRGERGYHLGYVELDADFKVVYEPDDLPLLPLGEPGCFDDRGMCMPNVVAVTDTHWRIYYVGWGPAQQGEMFVNRVGLLLSDDAGRTWRRWSKAPVLNTDDRDPIGIGTVHVMPERPDHWRLWYTSFDRWEPLPNGRFRHYYHIRYAESDDGIAWRKTPDNVAIDFIEDEMSVARPNVVRDGDRYRMWFCTGRVSRPYRIGYAESPDGRTWTRQPCNLEPSAEGWDSDMVEYAYVLKEADRWLMFYNGNGFGASGTGLAIAPREDA